MNIATHTRMSKRATIFLSHQFGEAARFSFLTIYLPKYATNDSTKASHSTYAKMLTNPRAKLAGSTVAISTA